MEGQGESQPAEDVASLDSLASMLESEGAASEESAEVEGAEESEGQEPEGEESEGEEQAEEAVFTITVDGKEISLKQSELIESAQKGFDYTNKTMAVAEERKEAQAEKARAAEARQRNEQAAEEAIARLETVRNFLAAELGEPPPIEWAATDAAYYLAQKDVYEKRKGTLQQAESALANLTNERQRERQAHLNQTAQATIEALRGTLPGFSEKTLPELEEYVQKHGLNLQNAEGGYVQKGLWELAHKAKAYDALMDQKAKLKPVNTLPKVIKPGNPQPVQLARHQEAVKAHKAKPSLDSLANLL